MDTPTPLPLTEIEEARAEADAYVGAFDDHRAAMDPTSRADLIRERQLYQAATLAAHRVVLMEAFDRHADQAIDLTGGQR